MGARIDKKMSIFTAEGHLMRRLNHFRRKNIVSLRKFHLFFGDNRISGWVFDIRQYMSF